MMEAIVLAGGLGTRLRSVVSDVPKPMAPVAGKPFLELLLTNLVKHGFTRIIISSGYMSEKIIEYFGSAFMGAEIVHEVEAAPLGTGGAVRASLRHCNDDHVYILNGDTYVDLDFVQIDALWKSHKKSIIILRQVEDTSRYGRVEVANNQRIVRFSEKGLSGEGLINAGCYVMPTHSLDNFPEGAFSLESSYFIPLVNEIEFLGHMTSGVFIDIGIPEDYAKAQTMFANVYEK